VEDSTGRAEVISYLPAGSGGCSLRVETSGAGRPTDWTEYNAFAQPVLEATTHWAPTPGPSRTTVREYGHDLGGRVIARGLPHLSGTSSVAYQRIAYDFSGRVSSVFDPWQRPDGSIGEHETPHRWIARGIGDLGTGTEDTWYYAGRAVRAHVAGEGAEASTALFDLRGDLSGRLDGAGTLTSVHRGRSVTRPARGAYSLGAPASTWIP
jgi:hypothetical protein